MLMTTDPGDLVLDPTCGSGTTAYVAEQWGRRWITIDTSRVALALARTRLMAAKFPYYLLADSPEGAAKEAELTGVPRRRTRVRPSDIRKGFVYKRVPHITLKSIAQQPRHQGGHDPRGDRRRDRAPRRDRAARRPALRGPTSESGCRARSPSRACRRTACSTERRRPPPPQTQSEMREAGTISSTMILDNLRKAGVQNTQADERLTFDRLEPLRRRRGSRRGRVHRRRRHDSKRVAVSIGPEHGTVGPHQVKEAAKEAVQGLGLRPARGLRLRVRSARVRRGRRKRVRQARRAAGAR